jgi:hypothetical protein
VLPHEKQEHNNQEKFRLKERYGMTRMRWFIQDHIKSGKGWHEQGKSAGRKKRLKNFHPLTQINGNKARK